MNWNCARLLDDISELREGDLEVKDIDKLTRLMRDGGRAESRYLESLSDYLKKREKRIGDSSDVVEKRIELLETQREAAELR